MNCVNMHNLHGNRWPHRRLLTKSSRWFDRRCSTKAISRQWSERARQIGLSLINRMVAHCINSDHSDYHGRQMPCPRCEQPARYAGRRDRTLTTALGVMTFKRAWYHCSGCRCGFAPRDNQLNLDSGSLSPAVTRMVGITAGQISFLRSSRMIKDLAGIRVGAKTVERHGESLGRRIAQDELEVIEPEMSDASTLYLGLDGTGIPVRKVETLNRKGKQPDGSAKTREVKLACVWTAESLNPKTSLPQRDVGSVSYNAAIETIACRDTDIEPAAFAKRVLRELHWRCFWDVKQRVVIGDGAAWIWNFADEHVPDAIEVVDIFHAKQHVNDAAKAIYGDTDISKAWSKRWRDELDNSHGVDRLIDELHGHLSCAPALKQAKYFENKRERMRYTKFKAQGICVSSGVLEGACKSLVGNRLKLSGMHWTVAGGNAIIALRCCVESDRFDDFWERQVGSLQG